MRRRALLAATTAAATVPLAGCPTPPWGEDPQAIDGAEVTFRREYDGEIADGEGSPEDAAELRRYLNADPPWLIVVGEFLDGARECYRVTLIEAGLDGDRLLLRLGTEDDPEWEGDACPDVAQTHPYSVEVAFREADSPDRVTVRHGDETVMDNEVVTSAVQK
jgi:hypothetical protein